MTVTVPTIYLLPVLLAPWVFLYVVLVRWLDRRWIDPWLRRRVGMPPKGAGSFYDPIDYSDLMEYDDGEDQLDANERQKMQAQREWEASQPPSRSRATPDPAPPHTGPDAPYPPSEAG